MKQIVVAYSRNRAIGLDGAIPWHISEDLKRFKRITMDTTLIMGRKTFDSIGRPLPGRRNIVITRNADWSHPGVETAHSLEDALGLAGPLDLTIMGGGEIYRQSLHLVDTVQATEVDVEADGDAFFPDLDPGVWQEAAREPHDGYAFVTYTRR